MATRKPDPFRLKPDYPGKPGPKPRPDSLTDAPLVAFKIHRHTLAKLDEARGDTGRAEWLRDVIADALEIGTRPSIAARIGLSASTAMRAERGRWKAAVAAAIRNLPSGPNRDAHEQGQFYALTTLLDTVHKQSGRL